MNNAGIAGCEIARTRVSSLLSGGKGRISAKAGSHGASASL